MTLEEKERNLIQEINFFNQSIEWWGIEFEKVNEALCQMEKNDPLGIRQKEMEKLVARMVYLLGKAKVEQKTADNIDKKLYKLSLSKDLEEIQGNFTHSKRKKK